MRHPYLIQRVIALKEPDERKKGVDRFFIFDYMGSAEFEFGALPEALKRMRANADKLVVEQFTHKLPTHNVYASFVGVPSEKEMARTIFLDQLIEDKLRFKEPLYLKESLLNNDTINQRYGSRFDGWWALDADAPWALFKFRKQAEQFLSCLKGE